MADVLFRFGVIADPQFSDQDAGQNFHKTATRYYRDALTHLEEAVKDWNAVEDPNLSFMLQLGDILDGTAVDNVGGAERSLERMMEVIDRCHCKTWYHAIGNHELYCFTLDQLAASRLRTRRHSAFHSPPADGQAGEGKEYYDWVPQEGWRFLMLHPFQLNIISEPHEGPDYERALKILRDNNPNDVLHKGVDWSKDMEGEQRRFVPFNGAAGEEQLAWLRRVLQHAKEAKEQVIVATHTPLLREASKSICLMWNNGEAREIMDSFVHEDGTPVVRLVFAGHDHNGGYAMAPNGTHHLTLASPLECEPGVERAYGVVEVLADDTIVVQGKGKVPELRLLRGQKDSE